MHLRLTLTALVAALASAVSLAGAAQARSILDPVAFSATPSHSAGPATSQPQGNDAGSATTPDGSAKKGKGYCVGVDSDNDSIPCPSHGKAAKKGKGYGIG